jgi:signal transduction histidine kinase
MSHKTEGEKVKSMTDQPPGAAGQKSVLRTGAPQHSRDELLSQEVLSEIGHKFGHEVGNPLTAIISLASILGRAVPAEKGALDALFSQHSQPGSNPELDRTKLLLTRLPDYANSITQEAWRISSLTETLVFLLSERANRNAASELEKSLNRALAKLNSRARIRKQLFDVKLPRLLPFFRVEQDQFVFLLGELLTNAAQAISDMEISPDRAISIELLPGSETGKGVIVVTNPIARPCPFELSSLFKPFVTEYGARKQLGLGLPTVAAIVDRHGGELELNEVTDERGRLLFQARLTFACGTDESEEGLDSSTAANSPTSVQPSITTHPQQVSSITTKAFTILIVEDDPSVATAIERILSATLGSRFSITFRKSAGIEAINLLGHSLKFDLILCDLNLNGTSGRKIYDTIQQTYPSYVEKFVFLTGDRNRKEVIRYLESTRRPYLLKPFDAAELEAAVLSLIVDKEK